MYKRSSSIFLKGEVELRMIFIVFNKG